MQEQVYSALDLAKALNINRNSVYYQVKNGSLPKPSMKQRTRKRGPHTYVWKRSELESNPYFNKAVVPTVESSTFISKAKEMREELGLSEIKEIVTDNELLRDAIEMRLDKLEENMKLIEKVVDLMNDRKEKKWWQI
tara:strand:- start:4614 stop:5024 length:411 start_codon:yes stop_codon:yes gene_type:complete